jgi:hypothetical protein
MKSLSPITVPVHAVLLLLIPLAAFAEPAAISDETVAAHRAALDVAGAFSNDGFKLRDGTYSGKVKAKQNIVVQVNLFAGNQYWFSVGATSQAKKMSVTVTDEAGVPVESELFQQDSCASAGFAPAASGPYYVTFQELEGEPATFCFVYSYK